MTDGKDPLQSNLERLKRSFDAVFQKAIEPPPPELLHLLSVRIGGATLAFDLAELSSVMRAPKIIPIPSHLPALLGLTGISARVVAVYSLATLIGAVNGDASVRWIAVSGSDPTIGLGFSQLERVEMVPLPAVRPAAAGAPPYVCGMMVRQGSPVWLIAISSITPGSMDSRKPAPVAKGEQ